MLLAMKNKDRKAPTKNPFIFENPLLREKIQRIEASFQNATEENLRRQKLQRQESFVVDTKVTYQNVNWQAFGGKFLIQFS
ncbi:MAG: hypothetical protein J0M15_03795 [Deltaproteobacteria bacterium]|nr:hypothetical protein [Deltaproteobacteria bacterium]